MFLGTHLPWGWIKAIRIEDIRGWSSHPGDRIAESTVAVNERPD